MATAGPGQFPFPSFSSFPGHPGTHSWAGWLYLFGTPPLDLWSFGPKAAPIILAHPELPRMKFSCLLGPSAPVPGRVKRSDASCGP